MEIYNELNFGIHCDKFVKQAWKVASIINHMSALFIRNHLLQVHKIYVQPIYQYGVLVYSNANNSLLFKIEKQQKW